MTVVVPRPRILVVFPRLIASFLFQGPRVLCGGPCPFLKRAAPEVTATEWKRKRRALRDRAMIAFNAETAETEASSLRTNGVSFSAPRSGAGSHRRFPLHWRPSSQSRRAGVADIGDENDGS